MGPGEDVSDDDGRHPLDHVEQGLLLEAGGCPEQRCPEPVGDRRAQTRAANTASPVARAACVGGHDAGTPLTVTRQADREALPDGDVRAAWR